MNNHTKIRICSIKRFYSILESLDSTAGIAAILCTTGLVDKNNLKNIPHVLATFADVTKPKAIAAFRIEKALRIKRFVDSLKNINVLYICCDSGESRSSAIAAAILRHWQRNDMAIWSSVRFHPNPLVYRLQCKAFGCTVSRLHVFALRRHNQRVFKKQVQKHR